jgi:hypothetical protein
MMNQRASFAAALFALTACAGGGSPISPTGQAGYSRTDASAAAPLRTKHRYGRVAFRFKLPRRQERPHTAHASPNFIPPSTASVTVVLTTVNGGPPPAGNTNAQTTSVRRANCGGGAGCSVLGPPSPPGTDAFTVTVKDGSGNALATGSTSINVVAGSANSGSLTLDGIPASFAITGLPGSGTAGTSIPATPLNIAVYDKAGDLITGTYSQSVQLSDGDTSGATQLAVNGVSGAPATIASSSAAVTFAYSGLAIAGATLTARATGATSSGVTFTPANSNPMAVCNGDGSGTTECATPAPALSLYAATGTGSSATVTLSQAGWSESPYSRTFTESDTCSGMVTFTSNDNVTFTATAASGAAAGSCSATFTGGVSLQTSVPVQYTTSSVGVHLRHRKDGSKP